PRKQRRSRANQSTGRNVGTNREMPATTDRLTIITCPITSNAIASSVINGQFFPTTGNRMNSKHLTDAIRTIQLYRPRTIERDDVGYMDRAEYENNKNAFELWEALQPA